MGESIDDPLDALEQARAHFASATDFTIGIEEEFQILDPDTLSLAQRYPELRALADASPLAGGVAGELIKSEIDIKTGRCETFAEAATLAAQRRRELFAVADEVGYELSASGTHP
ncbi:MAG: glutamate---cysteine ligase / carboxylate-amine ligase, partial [Gaiellaceae bacterium]|nr:glutamate---cysteine ligase / carboxylate-amine ligase [Gaiellaceae bacterium]